MSQFWSKQVHQLVPYVPGEQPQIPHLIKLNTNENPYPPSPAALAALHATDGNMLRLYPDPDSTILKDAIARFYAVERHNVFVGNGSDEVLAHTFFALLKHDAPLLFPDITYSFYPVYCQLYGITAQPIPLNAAFELQVDDYTRPNGGIIFPNPNAPTGRLLPLAAIEHIAQKNPHSVVVVDEAYIDFGGETAIPLTQKYPNILVIQTLSKSRSLAGLRIGFAVGHAELITALERVKNSFNSYPLDRLALAAATAAINDREYFDHTRHAIMRTRDTLSHELNARGFDVIPSAANFVFARHPQHDAAQLAAQLRAHAIIVRHFNAPRIAQFLRITIGTDNECQQLLHTLDRLLTTQPT